MILKRRLNRFSFYSNNFSSINFDLGCYWAYSQLFTIKQKYNTSEDCEQINYSISISSAFYLSLFITLPRYAITAMPEVLLFAAAGLVVILTGLKSRRLVSVTIKLLGSIILLLLLSKVNILRIILPLNSTDFIWTKLILVFSVVLKSAVMGLFFCICWQMFCADTS